MNASNNTITGMGWVYELLEWLSIWWDHISLNFVISLIPTPDSAVRIEDKNPTKKVKLSVQILQWELNSWLGRVGGLQTAEH